MTDSVPNKSLANYQMVIFLAMQTINEQFKKMAKMPVQPGSSQHVMRTEFGYWQTEDDSKVYNRQVVASKTEYEDAFNNFKPSLEDNEPIFIKGFFGTINVPFIEPVSEKDGTVNLTIVFKKAEYNSKFKSIKSTSIDGMKILFEVKPSLVPTRKTQQTEYISQEANVAVDAEVLRLQKATAEEGDPLTDEDFTIQTLFLDLENIDYINDTSVVPDNDEQKEISGFMQSMMSSYVHLSAKDGINPYVLGYTVVVPKLATRDKAVLQPTAMSYSVSYAANEAGTGADLRRSSVNYLMDTDKEEISPNKGRLDASLITAGDAKDGYSVFAIDGGLYKSAVIDPLMAQLTDIINNVFNGIENKNTVDTQQILGGPSQSSGKTLTVESTQNYSTPNVSLQQLINEGYTYSERKMVGEAGSSSFNPHSGASTGSGMKVKMYYKPRLTLSFDENGMNLFLHFQVKNNYYSYDGIIFLWDTGKRNGDASNYRTDKMPSSQSPQCQVLRIRLSPDSNGGFTACTKVIGENVFGIIKNEDGVVQDGNKLINSVGFYDSIKPDEILAEIENKIIPAVTGPRIILPLSNVYTYAGMNFDAPDSALDRDSVVAVQASYAPEYKGEK